MRMKMVCDDRTLAEVAIEFLALKKAPNVLVKFFLELLHLLLDFSL